jgi:hypothetical protein
MTSTAYRRGRGIGTIALIATFAAYAALVNMGAVAPAEAAAIEAAEGTGAATEGSAPTFLAQADGPSIIVPEGAAGPTPAWNGAGTQFADGAGGRGLANEVSGVRVMDPTPRYPNGYASYFNAEGQTVNPFKGETIPRAHPWAHVPLGR